MPVYNFYTDTGKRFQITESAGFGETPQLSDSDIRDILEYIQTNFGVATTITMATKDPDPDYFTI